MKGKSVVYISCGQAAPACAGTSGAAQEAAKTLGWNFKILDAKFNAGGAFGSAIRQAIVLKPDAIIVDSTATPRNSPSRKPRTRASLSSEP